MLGKVAVAPQMPVEEILNEMKLEPAVREYVDGKILEAERKEK